MDQQYNSLRLVPKMTTNLKHQLTKQIQHFLITMSMKTIFSFLVCESISPRGLCGSLRSRVNWEQNLLMEPNRPETLTNQIKPLRSRSAGFSSTVYG